MARLKPSVAIAAALPVFAAIVSDAGMSALGMAAILGATNEIIWLFSVVAGLITTCFVVATRYVMSGRAPVLFIAPWFICVVLDFYTTLACTDHFVVRKKEFDTLAALTFQFNDPKQAVIAFAVSLSITATAMSAPWVTESLPD